MAQRRTHRFFGNRMIPIIRWNKLSHDEILKEINQAILVCDDAKACEIIEVYKNIKQVNLNNQLIKTILANRLELVNTIIPTRENLNYIIPYNISPLHAAVSARNNAALTALVNRGANVDIANCKGTTPLHLAVKLGHSEIVKSLLEKGAITEIKDNIGRSALEFAVKQNDLKITKILLDHQANTNASNADGENIIFTAISRRV